MAKIQSYTLPVFTEKTENCVRILSFDPGSVNMGCSLIEIDKTDPKSIKVLANTVLLHPINDIKRFSTEKEKFINEINTWLQFGKPDAIVAERFQARGLRGTTIECVCIMLGLLASFKLPILLITAATWKNRYQSRFAINLKSLYKEILTAPHQLDSALIGCFGAESGLNAAIDFDIDDIINQVTDTSLVPLKKKKRIGEIDEDA